MEIITRLKILQRIEDCLSRKITFHELTAWADSVEFSEKFVFEERFEQEIDQYNTNSPRFIYFTFVPTEENQIIGQ